MNDALWAGAELKIEYGNFHLQCMARALELPERTHWSVAVEASGAILDTGWQRTLYPHFDAFLSVVRSIPEIIRACFGTDVANKPMRAWFKSLSPEEQAARSEFQVQYAKPYEEFRALPLSNVRHIIEHRTGVPDVEVKISGQFGVDYRGGPTALVPGSETRQIDDPNFAHLAKPAPIRPQWEDFTIEGRPLFAECLQHLERARALVKEARELSLGVHRAMTLTPPPS
jgi:hypothetical protein